MSNPWGFTVDEFEMLPSGEYWHRCDIRWLCLTAEGTEMVSEGPNVMFFRFTSRKLLHRVHRRLYAKGIKCLRYPNQVLAVCVPFRHPDCQECRDGALYLPT